MTPAAQQIAADLRERFVTVTGREPDSADLIATLAETIAALSQLVSPGYARWKPARKVAPPRQQRPAILDGEPETPSE